MSGFSSASWHQISRTRPRLSGRVRVSRQVFRGEPWYLIHDRVSGRFHRCEPALYAALARMDGERDVDTIWRELLAEQGGQALTQDDLLRFVSDLGRADLLAATPVADLREHARRRREQSVRRLKQMLANPVALRLPLFDPDRFLGALARGVAPVPTALVLLAWALTVLAGVVATGWYWPELTDNLVDQAFAWDNLLLVWLIFPLIKALHEIGHGLVTKARGGEVHEAGVMLLLFVPIPYIECSAATAFSSRAERVYVGAAGMMVDLFLGALALIVWTQIEPGLPRSLLFSVVLVTWVSTLLFNGNPLLRYDGYYVLCDAFELPNLAQRSNAWWGWWTQRLGLGVSDLAPPLIARGELGWLAGYAPLSYAYRCLIAVVIGLALASLFRPFGLMLAAWVIWLMIVWPALRSLHFVFTTPRIRPHRLRASLLFASILAALAFVMFELPVARAVITVGEVAATDRAILRVQASGFVARLLVSSGERVDAGQALLLLDNPELQLRLAELEAQSVLAQRRVQQAVAQRDAAAVTWREQYEQLRQELVRLQAEREALTLRAPQSGVLSLHMDAALTGRHLERGQVLGHVQGERDRFVRVALSQEAYERIDPEGGAPVLALRSRPDDSIVPLRWVGSSTGATEQLPSPILSRVGGGDIATDPADPEHRRTLRKVFLAELALPDGFSPPIGQRLSVRIGHRGQTLAEMVWHWLQRRLIEA